MLYTLGMYMYMYTPRVDFSGRTIGLDQDAATMRMREGERRAEPNRYSNQNGNEVVVFVPQSIRAPKSASSYSHHRSDRVIWSRFISPAYAFDDNDT